MLLQGNKILPSRYKEGNRPSDKITIGPCGKVFPSFKNLKTNLQLTQFEAWAEVCNSLKTGKIIVKGKSRDQLLVSHKEFDAYFQENRCKRLAIQVAKGLMENESQRLTSENCNEELVGLTW